MLKSHKVKPKNKPLKQNTVELFVFKQMFIHFYEPKYTKCVLLSTYSVRHQRINLNISQAK